MLTSIAVSGGFDPLHSGHLELFRVARNVLPLRHPEAKLIVFVDSDDYIAAKRQPIIPAKQRWDVVAALRVVDEAYLSKQADCCELLREVRPDIYGVGPDHRTNYKATPEYAACIELGIQFIVLQHDNTTHSSQLIKPKYENPPICASAVIHTQMGYGCDDYVLIGRSKTGWTLPGGFVEVGETLEQAVEREVHEETNIAVGSHGFYKYMESLVGTYFDGHKVVSTYFSVSALMRSLAPTDELLEFRWIDKSEQLSTDCDTEALRRWFERNQ